VSCYEAGRDGFWVHRWLVAHGADNHVMDSSSIEVSRRARRAKTDRLDLGGLLRVLIGWLGGERRCRMVRVPNVADEDARQLHRALATAKQDRTRVRNRIHSVLATMGVRLSLTKGFEARLAAARHWDDTPLPSGLQTRVREQWAQLGLLTQQIRALEKTRRAQLETQTDAAITQIQRLRQLRGVGTHSAWVWGRELFGWRQFRNGREVGAFVGLVPLPWRSGELARDQGVGGVGHPEVRVELAWGWLRYQPTSAIARWYAQRFAAGGGRMRRVGIVAVARRVLIALWRYAETGVVPEGARLKPVAA
jgi:transposase